MNTLNQWVLMYIEFCSSQCAESSGMQSSLQGADCGPGRLLLLFHKSSLGYLLNLKPFTLNTFWYLTAIDMLLKVWVFLLCTQLCSFPLNSLPFFIFSVLLSPLFTLNHLSSCPMPQAVIYTTWRNVDSGAEENSSLCPDSLSRGQCGNVIHGPFRATESWKKVARCPWKYIYEVCIYCSVNNSVPDLVRNVIIENHKVWWMDHKPKKIKPYSEMLNLFHSEPVFQVSGSKMTFPEQMPISSLLKGLN